MKTNIEIQIYFIDKEEIESLERMERKKDGNFFI